MTALSILLLLTIAISLMLCKHKKSGLTALIIAIVILLGTGCGLFPAQLLKNLQAFDTAQTSTNRLLSKPEFCSNARRLTDEEQRLLGVNEDRSQSNNAAVGQKTQFRKKSNVWGEYNAILVLGAGIVELPSASVQPSILSYSRLVKATAVYRDCQKSGAAVCKIILIGGDILKKGATEAHVYRKTLLSLGVIKPSDIQLEPKSLNTWQNVLFTEKLLKTRSFDRLLLVTSGIHIKRALLYFSYCKRYPIPIRADHIVAHISFIPQGYNFAMMDYALHEYIGILRFYLYNFMGWNTTCAA